MDERLSGLIYGREISVMVEERLGAPMPPSGGSCSSMDTEWWFPKKAANKQDLENQREAVGICRKCPIRKECLEYALLWEAFGIWGGLTEKQREAVRRVTGKKANVALLRNGLARNAPGIDMLIEHKDMVFLKKNGFLNAAA